MIALLLALAVAPARAAAAADDPAAVLRPLYGVWSGTVSCESGEAKTALELRADEGAPVVRYVSLLKSGKQEGKATVESAGRPRLLRTRLGQASVLLDFQADGRRFNIMTDPQAQGVAALARVQGDGKIDSKKKKADVRWAVTPAPGVPVEMLAAAGKRTRDSCKVTLLRQDAKPDAKPAAR